MYNNWFPDFVWKEKKLVIEIDGPSHLKLEQIQKDRAKDIFLKDRGWMVFRLVVPFTKAQATELINSIKILLA